MKCRRCWNAQSCTMRTSFFPTCATAANRRRSGWTVSFINVRPVWAEFRMETDARHIRCTACGFSAELDETYRLHGAPFTHINDWYFWQESLLDLAIPLESETVLAAVGPDGNMDKNAGAGRIYMDRDVIRYTGTCFGKPLAFTEKTEDIKAFPASVAAHFDIYHKKQLYNMHLRPDPRAVIKWVSYLDKLTRERETAAKNAEADNQNG